MTDSRNQGKDRYDTKRKKKQRRAQIIAIVLAILMISSFVIMFIQSLSY